MDGFRSLSTSPPPPDSRQGSVSPPPSARDDPHYNQMKDAINTETAAFSIAWVAHCTGGKADLNPNRFIDHGLKLYTKADFMPIQTRVFPLISRKMTDTLKRGSTWDSSAIDQCGESEMNLRKGLQDCEAMAKALTYLPKGPLSLLLHHMACDSLLRILLLIPEQQLRDLNYGATQWKRNHEKGVRVLRLNEREQNIGRYYLSKDLLRCGDKSLKPTDFFDHDFELLKKTIDAARGNPHGPDGFYPFLTVAFGGDKAPEDIVWAIHNQTPKGTVMPVLDFNNCIKLSATAVLHSMNHFANVQELHLANVQMIDDESLKQLASLRLPVLSVLNLAGCIQVTDYGLIALMESISRYHPIRLKHLNLSECTRITNRGLQAVGRLILDLEDLCIFSCPQFTDEALITFVRPTAKLRSLNYAGDYHISPTLIRQFINQNNRLLLYREPEEFPHHGFIPEGEEMEVDIDTFHISHQKTRSRAELIEIEEMVKRAAAGDVDGTLSLMKRPLHRKRASVDMTDVEDFNEQNKRREMDHDDDPYRDPYAN